MITDRASHQNHGSGAYVDVAIVAAARRLGLDTTDYLRRNDAYSFFGTTDGLIKTGPTHTNVCDVRVVLVEQSRG